MSAMISGNPLKVNINTTARRSNQNIQVYLRVRPTNERERLIRSIEMVEVPSHREVVVKQTYESKMSKKFTFDRAFGPESKQSDVYQSVVAPLIEEVLAGYNCTVFAYGQTGTGKTHTMVGDEIPTMVSSWEDDSELGIIPRSLSHLFQELRLMGVEFSMRVSYLELYNEELCDLLSPSETAQIRIFDDANKKGSIIVQGLEEIPVHTTGDVYKLLAKGQDKRRTAATLMNAQSSRSHTIFSITVHIRENGMDGEELLKIGKLNLVDLAGSENLSKAGNEKGIRTRETVNINQSLLTLGRVITALVERTPHIPYRESKLTRLLQESLGGRTKTSIIATVSPGHKDLEETLSTLEYAHRAKNIQNRPEVNQKLTKKTVLKEYTEEIDRLKRDLMASRDKNGIYLAEETYQEMTFRIDSQNKDLNEKVLLIKAMKEDMANKQRVFTEISLNLVEKATELESTQGRLADTAQQLDQTKSALRTTNRRYQEKKHLVENHLQTEQLLTGQATALISVVDAASTDTYRLQDTIDRRRSVDAKIRTATEQHALGMDEHLQQFNALLEQTMLKSQVQSRVQVDEISQSVAQSDRFTSATLLRLKHLGETGAQAADSVLQCVRSGVGTLTSECNALNGQLTDSTTQLHASLNTYLQYSDDQLSEMRKSVGKQLSTNADSMTELMQLHSKASTDCSNFCSQSCVAATNTMPIVQQLVDRHQQHNAQFRTEIAANSARMRDMHNQMRQMFETIEQSNAAYTAQVNHNDATMAELLHVVSEHSRLSVRHTEDYSSMAAQQYGNLATALEQRSKALSDECAVQQERIEQHLHDNNRHSARLAEQLNDTLGALSTQHTQTSARIAQLQLEVEQLQTAAAKASGTEVDTIVGAVQTESQRQRNAHSVCSSLTDTMQRDLAEYAQRVGDHVRTCRGRIESFHRQELQTYRSTGETPAKREFVYSKQLAQTSPHDRIVRRFWTTHDGSQADLDCSVTICEGNESAFLDGITDDKSSSILQAQLNSGVAPALLRPTSCSETDDLGVNVLQEKRSITPTLPGQRSRIASKSPRRHNRSDDKSLRQLECHSADSTANKENES